MKQYSVSFWLISTMILIASPTSLVSAENQTVQYSFLDVSPDRSLPIVMNPNRELRRRIGGQAESTNSPQENAKGASVSGAWNTALKPARSLGSFDRYELSVQTNEPTRAESEIVQLFRAIGFLPAEDHAPGQKAGVIDVRLSFFGDLAFVYGGPFPVVVLRRVGEGSRYILESTTPSMPGEIEKKNLGRYPVFVLDEDQKAASQSMARTYPTAKRMVLWDRDGVELLRLRYSAAHWGDSEVLIESNTMVLSAPCGRTSSSLACETSGNACQLSLLDPDTKEPVVLQATVSISYQSGALVPQEISVRLIPAIDFRGHAVICRRFTTLAKVVEGSGFGVCGRNLDGVSEWRCLGTSDGYINESVQHSRDYWRALKVEIDGPLEVPVVADASVMRIVNALESPPKDDCASPSGLGHGDVVGFIRTTASAFVRQ